MTKVITLMCQRSVELNGNLDASGKLKDVADDVHVIKFPCSGMIQPLMIEAALKSGADGVVVCGCQLGDCYYREGNRMIRDRLLGNRPPGLKKAVDRRRVEGLWLAKPQVHKFIEAIKEFVARIKSLPIETAPATAPANTSGAKPATQTGVKPE
jgi:coenzyme F420-reducing hydrogenase delta subunit